MASVVGLMTVFCLAWRIFRKVQTTYFVTFLQPGVDSLSVMRNERVKLFGLVISCRFSTS